MDLRQFLGAPTIAATALVGAVAVGVVGFAIGNAGRGGDETLLGLTSEQRAEVETLIADAGGAAGPAATPVGALSPAQANEVRALIRSHLIENPDIIAEAINELQTRQQQAELTAQTDAIQEHAGVIFTSGRHVVIGNPDGDVTLVEFFDYNCHFCRRALADVQQLIEDDPNLRVVLKEFPVLGEGSVEAAQVSVAVNMIAPEKYPQFHFALLGEHGQVDGRRAMAVAEEIGIDPAELEPLLDSLEVRDAINEVYEIAGLLNLTGTPTFVTEAEVLVGAVGFDALAGKVSELRSN